MSWSVSGLVVDGNTEALEFMFDKARESAAGTDWAYDSTVEEQFEFGCSIVSEAFDAEVVDGAYSISMNGHSNPSAEGDRKSFAISFNPVSVEYAEQQAQQQPDLTNTDNDPVEVDE